ncbi:tetratricopeptide repeat protein [Luteimonas sp. Y-2-2-4F]|nr:tetratricopeptide repeat protein [Luteimonas sp. Y-2-2-4F]MCD9032625.1 tetratricopeptide repeat protein [Luteimonas sp. Y-2-2-4F]
MHDKILDALRRGAHDEAIAAARAALDANPADVRAWELLASAQRASGDHVAALDSLDRAIALAPEDASLHFQRAAALLGARDLEGAETSLARTLELDPNRFGAYIVQAELAIARGDFDEADRLATLAARLGEGHPALSTVRGMIALRRGELDRALSILSQAAQRSPDDPQLLNALAAAYIAKDHLAFAEQTLLRLLRLAPQTLPSRRLLAEVVLRQGRPGEAAQQIAPALEGPSPSPEHLRFAGALALRLGRAGQAVAHLKRVLAAVPGDTTTVDLLLSAWQALGDREDAVATLEAALATTPQVPALWQARLAIEPPDEAVLRALIERWSAAVPDSVAPLRARLNLEVATGATESAEAIAREIARRAPEDPRSHSQLLDLLTARDPETAIEYLRELEAVTPAEDEVRRRQLQGWMAMAQENAGHHAEAVEQWARMHADWADRLVVLPSWSPADAPRAARAEPAAGAPRLVFMAGLPGSGHEHVGRLLDGVVGAFRADRLGDAPPRDPMQNVLTVGRLASGETTPRAVHDEWRAQLAGRAIGDGALIDWLLWWDNALLDVTRAHLPHAELLMVIRDPRDMLVNWLAFGSPVPFRLGTPEEGAAWLAQGLEHVAVLQEQDLQPVRVLRTDDTVNDPAALALPVGEALGLTLPAPPAGLFNGRRFPAGHWRRYTGALAGPFATLTPVAVRLGYPDN